MADRSPIEWTDATWNPVTGCTKVSPGCDHCYAERIHDRFNGAGSFGRVRYSEEKLYLPLSWRKPRRVFVNSMSDLFHDRVPTSFIHRVWSVMARTPQHTYQVLTKRHGRMRTLIGSPDAHRVVADIVGADIPWPLPNVWLGVSAEDQQRADLRALALLDTPAAVRWISAEPLLGPISIRQWCRPIAGCRWADPDDGLCIHPAAHTPECHRWADCPPGDGSYGGIDWVVVGGESGPKARPMHPSWARLLRDECQMLDVPYFFKQHGEWIDLGQAIDWGLRPGGEIRAYPGNVLVKRVGKKAAGRVLDGRTWDEYPGQRRPVRSTLVEPVTASRLAAAGIDPAGHVAAGLADGTR